MVKKNPMIIFLFSKEGTDTSTRYGGFSRRLKKYGNLDNVDTLTCALENLIFTVSEKGTADIVDIVTGTSLNAADLVYIKSWESTPEEASAVTTFLESRGVPYVDGLPKGVGISKLSQMFRMWSAGVRVPQTFYIRNHVKLSEYISSLPKGVWPLVMKDALGEKGKHNFLVHTTDEVKQVLESHSQITFLCQRMVPNDGDYRVGVYMGKASFGLLRTGSSGSHLNNTSAGGSATHVAVSDLPTGVAAFAEEAAVAADLKIAGVDVIIDKNTRKKFILEVNQGSQIVTGANTKENIEAFTNALKDSLRLRHPRQGTKPLTYVGRRTYASLPELGVDSILAKVDTGAYTSSIHAENIVVSKNTQGEDVLSFEIVPGDTVKVSDNQTQKVSTTDFFQKTVTSSNGHAEERYVIRTMVTVEGRTFKSNLTLADRSHMSRPLLIGRKLLRSRFIVNVELSEHDRAEWNY